jgi:hypothetical protein
MEGALADAKPEPFPRGTFVPGQSPLFWVTHKDRYLRQLLIKDIEAETGRALIVYFADCAKAASGIDSGDDVYFAELLNGCNSDKIDLLIETNGGETDATEKICSLLRGKTTDLRVLVPRRAKSNGTVIALTGKVIVMGMESELGPIDPSLMNIPVEFILNAPAGTVNAFEYQMAETGRKQTQKLAETLLSTGMLAGTDPGEIKTLVDKIATRDVYHSHGSVIDAKEANGLGLKVEYLDATNQIWVKVCLLRAMYQHDCTQVKALKIFEGNRISLVVAAIAA